MPWARAAASGLDLSGSPLDVLQETVNEYDILTIYNFIENGIYFLL